MNGKPVELRVYFLTSRERNLNFYGVLLLFSLTTTIVHLPQSYGVTKKRIYCRIFLFHHKGKGFIPAFSPTFDLCVSMSLWLAVFSMFILHISKYRYSNRVRRAEKAL
jgi:hypothetical protein